MGKFLLLVFAFVCIASGSCFSRSSISSSQILGCDFFSEKNNPIVRISASDLYDKIGCINKPLPKENSWKQTQVYFGFVQISPSNKSLVTLSSRKVCFSCCFILLWAYLLKQRIVCIRKEILCKKETHQPFLIININFVCEKIFYDRWFCFWPFQVTWAHNFLVTKHWKLLAIG